jgi:hypothetical protein
MRLLAGGIILLLLANSTTVAQLIIDNSKHLSVPEDQARLLLRMSCRAVAAELHLRGSNIPEFEMHLVLGEKDEGFGYAESTGTPTLFLREWNEKKFLTAALKFAVRWSIDQNRQEKMILEILDRYERTVPKPASSLHNFVASPSGLPLPKKPNCLSEISDATMREVRCDGPPGSKAR